MNVETDRVVTHRRTRARGPVLAFVAVALLLGAGLRLIAASGVANPRLSGASIVVFVNGVAYEQVAVFNQAPTTVEIQAARLVGADSRSWPRAYLDGGLDCLAPELVPVESVTLRAGESTVIYVPIGKSGGGSGRVEVRARTRSGLVRVVKLPTDAGGPGTCVPGGSA